MKLDYVFKAVVKNNELEFSDKRALKCVLQPLEGKSFDVIIKQCGRIRSLNQNNYYWLCLTIIGESLGYTPQEMHALMKSMFLSKEINIKGKFHKIVGTTTKLKTSDFGVYLDSIIRWASENQIILPDPNAVEV